MKSGVEPRQPPENYVSDRKHPSLPSTPLKSRHPGIKGAGFRGGAPAPSNGAPRMTYSSTEGKQVRFGNFQHPSASAHMSGFSQMRTINQPSNMSTTHPDLQARHLVIKEEYDASAGTQKLE